MADKVLLPLQGPEIQQTRIDPGLERLQGNSRPVSPAQKKQINK